MPYNTRLRGKNPYNAGEVDKKDALASPTKKAKLSKNDAPTSPTKKSRKREHEEIDSELKNMKKKLNSQINELNGTKPSEITPKPNFNKYKKRGSKKVGGKKISKKYNEQKRKNILKNVDASNLKHVRCVVNSEILSKGLCNTINSLGPEKIMDVLKNGKSEETQKTETEKN
ncbi:hypothetical protein BCR32DRAFT_280559 [Anaeromyces robustus]|uniref:Uncharacterized protein n=1 Tax=Anaeromyces robustus TaxID=1754192 RepID=A0A1Y1X466_9FUNG|nr:hypothetical protein BCR32DRAFT_280559 [Anaeromyces robustus]|eukprot:ORX80428.1 hypothetical protein BCR32DRAFT_280559 [Anaeromyces robustus]